MSKFLIRLVAIVLVFGLTLGQLSTQNSELRNNIPELCALSSELVMTQALANAGLVENPLEDPTPKVAELEATSTALNPPHVPDKVDIQIEEARPWLRPHRRRSRPVIGPWQYSWVDSPDPVLKLVTLARHLRWLKRTAGVRRISDHGILDIHNPAALHQLTQLHRQTSDFLSDFPPEGQIPDFLSNPGPYAQWIPQSEWIIEQMTHVLEREIVERLLESLEGQMITAYAVGRYSGIWPYQLEHMVQSVLQDTLAAEMRRTYLYGVPRPTLESVQRIISQVRNPEDADQFSDQLDDQWRPFLVERYWNALASDSHPQGAVRDDLETFGYQVGTGDAAELLAFARDELHGLPLASRSFYQNILENKIMPAVSILGHAGGRGALLLWLDEKYNSFEFIVLDTGPGLVNANGDRLPIPDAFRQLQQITEGTSARYIESYVQHHDGVTQGYYSNGGSTEELTPGPPFVSHGTQLRFEYPLPSEDDTAGLGLIPAVTRRYAGLFGGKQTRLYRGLVGPLIEETLGEYIPASKGWRRAASYIPRGFGLWPVIVMGMLHRWMGPAIDFHNMLGWPSMGVFAVGVLLSAALRRVFVLAHPEGLRTAPKVIAALNTLFPPVIALLFHFSPLGLAFAFLASIALHSFTNVFWSTLVDKWVWRDVHSPQKVIRAIDSSVKEYDHQHNLDWGSEFLLPRVSSWKVDRDMRSQVKEVLFGVCVEILLGLHFAAVLKVALEWLYEWARRLYVQQLIDRGHGEHAEEVVQEALKKIKGTQSLAEKRRLFRSLFRRSGYLWAKHVMKEFDTTYRHSEPSTVTSTGDRELAIQMLEGYFYGVMRAKGGKISDPEDREILRFLTKRLADPDERVVNAAMRAIRVVSDYLSVNDRQRFRSLYVSMLYNHPSLVVRGSIAREFAHPWLGDDNGNILVNSLAQGRQKPRVEAYLTESIEYRLERNPLDPIDDQETSKPLTELLLRKAKLNRSFFPVRTNALRALAYVMTIDNRAFRKLEHILFKDPEPVVEKTAIWAMARLAVHGSPGQMEIFLNSLVRFAGGDHAGQRRPQLEQYALSLFWRMEPLNPNKKEDSREELRREASAVTWPAPVVVEKPVVLVDIGEYKEDEMPVLSAVRRRLEMRGDSVLLANAFREDRDTALYLDPLHPHNPQMRPRMDIFVTTVENLKHNRAVRIGLWDHLRGKRARRMEREIHPTPGRPIVIFARHSDILAIQQACGGPINNLRLADFTHGDRINYPALLRALEPEPEPAPTLSHTNHHETAAKGSA